MWFDQDFKAELLLIALQIDVYCLVARVIWLMCDGPCVDHSAP